jgi:hypothetical protein
MQSQKRLFSLLNYSLLFLITSISISAQPLQPAESNYDATLHVLVASGQGSTGTELPQSLSSVSRQVKNEFGVSNLRLINTYLGRMTDQGSLEQKGVSNAYTPEPQPGSPSFLDWNLVGLRTSQGSNGQDTLQFQSFRFGARIPVRIGVVQDERAPAPVNYESIGLTLQRLNLRENSPTLIGTLIQPKTDATLFLVLTVKDAGK